MLFQVFNESKGFVLEGGFIVVGCAQSKLALHPTLSFHNRSAELVDLEGRCTELLGIAAVRLPFSSRSAVQMCSLGAFFNRFAHFIQGR